MKSLRIAFALVLLLPLLGCAGITGPKSPKQAFLYAKALYRDELSVAVAYSDACVQGPTVNCAEMVQRLDEINKEAASYILAGELLLDGFVGPEMAAACAADDIICIERQRSQKMLELSSKLQAVSAALVAVRGDSL